MPNFLEELVSEWYEYQGYFVRRNVRVGPLPLGSFESELDVVAFHPGRKHLVHIEPSTDADSWAVREEKFKRKFEAARKYIPDLFQDFLPTATVLNDLKQIALLVFMLREERPLAGGQAIHVSMFLKRITDHFSAFPMTRAQVSEQFPILRGLQFVAEYRKCLFPDGAPSAAPKTGGKRADS